MDLDPTSEVLSVDLERLARPGSSGETGDLSRRDSSESEHYREHRSELIATALLRAVEYPMGDIAVLVESVGPPRAVIVQSEVGGGVAVNQIVLDGQHLVPCGKGPRFVDYRLSYFFNEIAAPEEEIIREIIGVATSRKGC